VDNTRERPPVKIPEKKIQIQKGMMQVCYALVPCVLASVWLFGLRSLAVLLVSLAVGTATEALFTFRDGRPVTSAVFVTSMIFALSLPPTVPFWVCAVGIAFGVGLGKMAFGGFGKNIFNPAMAGRCFVYVSFPLALTNSWVSPFTGGAAGGFAAWAPPADAVTGATPLEAIRAGAPPAMGDLVLGTTGGSLGDTSALLVILGGAWIIWKKVAPWRIALSCLLGALAVSLLGSLAGSTVPPPGLTLFSGSLLFGAAFVATEPVSAAKTREAQWIYGFAIGAVTVLLRAFSNFSEGIMFSVLMMNAFAPLLDRIVRAVKARPAAVPETAA
jgi:Na+-transporting NADH:ubiquinone oxidoreductase subunit B